MKSLGQIAYEASQYGSDLPWDEQMPKEEWERMAQAVRAAVIEECAKACEDRWPELHPDDPILTPCHDESRGCAAAIRSLK